MFIVALLITGDCSESQINHVRQTMNYDVLIRKNKVDLSLIK